MTPPLVDYLVARAGLPRRSGIAYDYVLGGDGVFIVAANPLLELRVPVAACDIRGLAPVFAACTLVHGRIPGSIWNDALRFLRAAHVRGSEILVGIRHDGDGYRLIVPSQIVAPLAVRYKPQPGWLVEMHSHRDVSAHFSATDCADEQGLRLYGVVGRLDEPRPQVNLRAGAYGYFLPVPWTSVFDGDPSSVEDLNAEGDSAEHEEWLAVCPNEST